MDPAYYEAKRELERRAVRGLCIICFNALPKGKRKYCSDVCFHKWFAQFNPQFLWSTFREKVLERDNYMCVQCDHARGAFETMIADHITPIALGGPEFDMDNCQTLCPDCNRVKTREDAKRIAKLRRAIKLSIVPEGAVSMNMTLDEIMARMPRAAV